MSDKIVFLASDHRGVGLKTKLSAWLDEQGYAVRDLGTQGTERCDAGDFAVKLAEALRGTPAAHGVLICGTGQAMTMTANRYRHIRAALCAEPTTARLTREHNDANVLVLGADVTGAAVAMDCLQAFLKTAFLGGRYTERRDKLTALSGI